MTTGAESRNQPKKQPCLYAKGSGLTTHCTVQYVERTAERLFRDEYQDIPMARSFPHARVASSRSFFGGNIRRTFKHFL